MKKFKLQKVAAILTIIAMLITISTVIFAADGYEEALATPANLVLNRGHVENLAFGGPMGLSWAEVENRETFTVFVFNDSDEQNPEEAYLYISDIDALYLYVNDVVAAGDGPFWFRVKALAADFDDSELSAAIGPFWNFMHSDEFAANPEGSYALFSNPNIPVIIIDTRRLVERKDQGNIVGDVHINWPNAVGVEEGITHAEFQAGVIAAWQNFIENDLTDEQRESLHPEFEYRDIRMFVY